jgi:hypothetical protein
MSIIKKPSDRLLDLFVPVMEREGYQCRKSNHRFLKTFPHGTDEFSLIFDGRSGLVAVDAGFFVHFTSLKKVFKNILGHECPWQAGATLLNAGAKPWNFFLFEDGYASMTPQERSGIPTDVIHPDWKLQACVQFLTTAHANFAQPFFQQLQAYRQLADFYREYLTAGCQGRCRPLAENVVYLSLILAAFLGDNLDEIVAFSQGMGSVYVGHSVAANVQKILDFVRTNDVKKTLT